MFICAQPQHTIAYFMMSSASQIHDLFISISRNNRELVVYLINLALQVDVTELHQRQGMSLCAMLPDWKI